MGSQERNRPVEDGLDEERRLIASFDGYETKSWLAHRGNEHDVKDAKKSSDYLKKALNCKNEDHEGLDLYNRSIAYAPVGSRELELATWHKLLYLQRGQKHSRLFKKLGIDVNKGNSRNGKANSETLEKWLKMLEEEIDKEDWDWQHILDTKATVPFPVSPAIGINFSRDKYGRHVTARRNISTGEILAVENNVFTFTNKKYVYCSCCLRSCWIARACDKCVHHVYCSARCKQKAWSEYHEFECPVYSRLSTNNVCDLRNQTILTFVRGLVMAVGRLDNGLDELRSLVAQAHSNKDSDLKSYDLDEIYNLEDVGIVYCRKACEYSNCGNDEVNNWTSLACTAAYILATQTFFFGPQFGTNVPFKEILGNPNVLFATALLLRSYLVLPYKHFHIHGFSAKYDELEHMGTGIYPFCSTFNHSCIPNADYFVTDDNELVVYARQTIKKDSQIFIAYNKYDFVKMPRNERQKKLKMYYDFTCTCEACINDYDMNTLVALDKSLNPYSIEKFTQLEERLQTEFLTCSREDLRRSLKNTKKCAEAVVSKKSPFIVHSKKFRKNDDK